MCILNMSIKIFMSQREYNMLLNIAKGTLKHRTYIFHKYYLIHTNAISDHSKKLYLMRRYTNINQNYNYN